MKESSRELVASEVAREQLSSELESLRLQLREGGQWQTDRQVLSLSLPPFLSQFLIYLPPSLPFLSQFLISLPPPSPPSLRIVSSLALETAQCIHIYTRCNAYVYVAALYSSTRSAWEGLVELLHLCFCFKCFAQKVFGTKNT